MKHLKISLYTAILLTTLNGKKTTIIIQTNSILERYYVTNTHHQAAKIESIVITMLVYYGKQVLSAHNIYIDDLAGEFQFDL